MADKPESFRESVQKIQQKGNQKANQPGPDQMGKMPPQALELEEAILGALMLEKNAISLVLDVLKPESFYKESHKEIYRAVVSLFEQSQPVDLLTVTNQLRSDGQLEMVGGPAVISELTNKVGSTANIEYHARIVAEKHILRELIRISGEIQGEAFKDTTDVFDLLDKAEKELFDVTQGNLRSSYESMNELITKAIRNIEERNQNQDSLSGIPSGFTNLDRNTSGWQPSDLIITASRPGMGKTSFVLSLARNAAVDFGHAVAIFSLEMSSLQLVHRLISAEAEIDAQKLRHGNLEAHEWTQMNVKIGELSDAPIYIDDTPAINIFELRAKCRRLKAQNDIQLVIVDYLQLMSAQSESKQPGNREQEISSISRALKGIAKELNIPVIGLSQLSRAVETRGGSKRPILSDLRESGSIEQDADQVMFLYRPEYYGITEDEEGNPTEGMAELIIAKNRHGSVTTVPAKFINKFAKFDVYDEYTDQPTGQESMITRESKINKDEESGSKGEAPF